MVKQTNIEMIKINQQIQYSSGELFAEDKENQKKPKYKKASTTWILFRHIWNFANDT